LKLKEQEKWEKLKEKNTKKSKKSEGSPFRAKTAFIWFYQENYSSLAKEVSETQKQKWISENNSEEVPQDIKIPSTLVVKLASEKFKSLPESDKARYEEMAKLDKERYVKQKSVFDKTRKKGKVSVTTPYFRFLNEVREKVKEENPGLKVTELAKVIGQKWKELPEEKKEAYRQEYLKEVEELKSKEKEVKKENQDTETTFTF